MLTRLSFAALVLGVSVSGASGLAALIGDAFVKLPPPAGFCELTPSMSSTAALSQSSQLI